MDLSGPGIDVKKKERKKERKKVFEICEAISLVILHKRAWLNLARGQRGKTEI